MSSFQPGDRATIITDLNTGGNHFFPLGTTVIVADVGGYIGARDSDGTYQILHPTDLALLEQVVPGVSYTVFSQGSGYVEYCPNGPIHLLTPYYPSECEALLTFWLGAAAFDYAVERAS